MIYFPDLSIEENAIKNGVTVHAVRQYIKRNNIDRRTDEQLRKRKSILDQNKKGLSISQIAERTGYSPNTVRKYLDQFKVDEYKETVNPKKVSLYNCCDNANVKRSINYNQNEILKDILDLYITDTTFDCDLTYSTGVFYLRLEKPKYRFDRFPQSKDVSPLDEAYSIPKGTLKSVIFDLPFIIKPFSDNSELKIKERFGCFHSIDELIKTNQDMLRLSYDLLEKGGYLVVKTQDTNYTGIQVWTSFILQQYAFEIGFELMDVFILIANHAITGKTLIKQRHARKYHSYFFVFRKK